MSGGPTQNVQPRNCLFFLFFLFNMLSVLLDFEQCS